MHRALITVFSLTASAAAAGVTPGGLADTVLGSAGLSTVVTHDNQSPFTLTRGWSSAAPGSGTITNNGGQAGWVVASGVSTDYFATTDSVSQTRTGRVTLDESDGARTQAVVSHGLGASAFIPGAVSYTLSVIVTPTVHALTGDSNASLSMGFWVNMYGVNGPNILLSDSIDIDLRSPSGVYTYSANGIFDPGSQPGSLFISSDSALSAVVDAPGESADVAYTMSIRLDLAPVPAPGTLTAAIACGVMVGRRRRVST
jgi:hypothetical protein